MHFHIIRYTSHIFRYSPAETLVPLPAVTGVAVVKEGGVALGKGKRELLKEVANGGGLLLSSAQCAVCTVSFARDRTSWVIL